MRPRLASTSLAGRECDDLEPRVMVERNKKLLSSDAGGAEDGNAAAGVSTHLIFSSNSASSKGNLAV